MKSNLAERQTSSSTMQSVKGSFKADAKAFQFVLSGIYSNKPESITREIWTNAWDAHKEAGNSTTPFNVVFPGSLDPTFRVRDFGTGLSHKFMMERYPVIFDSTKDQDNKAVGKWGAGRMAPFSYTDSFSVTSYYNGSVGFYTVFKSSDGGIEVAHMGSQPTTERNGVEISFPIDKADIPAFRKAATKIALGFDVKPNICNGRDFEWPSYGTSLEGKRWRMYKDLPYVPFYRRDYQEQYVPKGPHARMGCVIYPINVNNLGLGSHSSNILNKDIVIDFEIGDLEVTASREDLSYGSDEPTKDSILEAVAEIEKDMLKEIEAKVHKAQSVFDAASILTEAYSISRSHTFQESVNAIKWRGENNVRHKLHHEFPFDMVEQKYRGIYPSIVAYQKPNIVKSVQVYYVNTEKKNKDVRVRDRIAVHSNQSYQLRNKVVVYYDSDDDLADKKKQVDYWLKTDTIEHIYVKDIPDPGPKNPSSSRKVHVKSIARTGYFDDTVLDDTQMKEGGIYLPIANNEIQSEDRDRLGFHATTYNLATTVYAIQEYNSTTKTFVAVPKTKQKAFIDSDKWVTVYDYIEEFAKNNYQIILTTWYYNYFRRNVEQMFSRTSHKILPDFPQFNHPWSADLLPAVNPLYEAVEKFKPDYKPNIKVPCVGTYKKDLKDKYPMLFDVHNGYDHLREHKQSELIKDYINLVNKGN